MILKVCIVNGVCSPFVFINAYFGLLFLASTSLKQMNLTGLQCRGSPNQCQNTISKRKRRDWDTKEALGKGTKAELSH